MASILAELKAWPLWRWGMLGLMLLLVGMMLGDCLSGSRAPVPLPSPTATRVPLPTITFTPSPTVAPSATPTLTPPPTATPIPTDTPTPTPIPVITGIHAFGRLETVQYTMRDLVEVEDEPGNLFEHFSRDKLLLIAEGEVTAGFDLAQVREADIIVTGRRVTLRLPPAQILYSRVDNERTSVYERETGLLRRPDPDLESEARRLAERRLLNWAIERGILVKAEEIGKVYLENFLRALGFTEVTIEIRQP